MQNLSASNEGRFVYLQDHMVGGLAVDGRRHLWDTTFELLDNVFGHLIHCCQIGDIF